MTNSPMSTKRIIFDSVIVAFVVGVVASLFANSMSAAKAHSNYSLIVALAFGALLAVATCVIVLLTFELRRLGKNASLAAIPGCQFRSAEKLSMADLLDNVRSEVCFLGITAKRTFTDDRFKEFLAKCSGTNTRVRVLLLDPASEAFARRAREEREQVESWKQELEATIQRLRHYHQTYGVAIDVHLYQFHPTLRLIIADNRSVVVNFFLEGKRGTESAQLTFDDNTSDLSRFFVKWFDVVWRYHSTAVKLETTVV